MPTTSPHVPYPINTTNYMTFVPFEKLRVQGGWDMLIFQPHPPHILRITCGHYMTWAIRKLYFERLGFHINMWFWRLGRQHQSPKAHWVTWSSGTPTVMPDIAAFVAAAALVEWAWNLDASTPAFCRQVLSHLAIVLDVTGPCLPIKDRNRKFSLGLSWKVAVLHGSDWNLGKKK